MDLDYPLGAVSAGQTTAISASWMAEDAGTYTVNVFMWDGLGEASVPQFGSKQKCTQRSIG